jgi:hypothetical protein
MQRRPARGLVRSDRVSVLTTVFGVGMGYFLAVEPTQPWALLLLAVLVGLGMDGIIRSHPVFGRPIAPDTTASVLVPVLFTLSAGLFLEDAVSGYWSLAAAAGVAILFGAVAYAELVTLTPADPVFLSARLILSVVAYVSAFGLFAVLFSYDVSLVPASLLAGCIAALLSVEVLREAETEAGEMVLHAVVIGVIVGEVRWALHFLPIDGYLGGLSLLLAFYLLSELLRAHLVGHLDWQQGFEYASVTGAGAGVIIIAKIIGGD